MKKIIDVFTGEIEACNNSCELVSHAIGSCIVITAYDPIRKLGCMAHVMLPGKAPENKQDTLTRYAQNAIEELVRIMDITPKNAHRIEICLIGGGNVLKRADDAICHNNIFSVKKLMKNWSLFVSAESLGGTERRSVRFDVEKGEVYMTKANSKEWLLWKSHYKEIDD